MASLNSRFYKKLLDMSSRLGMNPEAYNAAGHASGLVQIIPSTLEGLGYKGNYSDFKNVAAEDQLVYIEKLIKNIIRINGGPLTSAAQYYIGNFIPAALKIPGVKLGDPSAIIVSRNPKTPHIPGVGINKEKLFYRKNSGLDYDKSEDISFGDIQKVLSRAANSKNFQNAIMDLKRYTGYTPKKKTNMKRPNVDLLSKQETSSTMDRINSILDKYLHQIAASERQDKKLYKKYLPNNNIIITVKALDYTDAIEFSHILSLALDEELLATSNTHTDGNNVEVECSINGPKDECFDAVKQLSLAISEAFRDATIKIGGININPDFIINKKSSYRPIDLRSAEMQHRKF